jgi:hypothetical protein
MWCSRTQGGLGASCVYFALVGDSSSREAANLRAVEVESNPFACYDGDFNR